MSDREAAIRERLALVRDIPLHQIEDESFTLDVHQAFSTLTDEDVPWLLAQMNPVYTVFHADGPIRLTEHELVNEYMRQREDLGFGRETVSHLMRKIGETGGRETTSIPLAGDVALFAEWLENSPHTGAWGVVGREILERLLAELAAAREREAKLRKALDAAMQYVPLKDHAWLEGLADGEGET